MDMATWVQILDKVVYISHCTNNPGKSMHQTILSPAMSK